MKARLAVGTTALVVVAGFWGGCGVEEHEDSEGWNLEGRWGVSAVRFDNVVIQEYGIFIEQEGDSVALWREDETISLGEVRGDTLFCSDWYGYAIGRIFIDDWRHMHSETPGSEQLKVILFER